MVPLDANSLLAPPPGCTHPVAVRWLASEVVAALCARVDLPSTGPHVRLFRVLLLAAWRRREAPTLDGLLDAALCGGTAAAGVDPSAVLALSLRFVAGAPEFGGRAPDARGRQLYERLDRARSCVASPPVRPAASLLCARLDARAAA